MTSTNHKIDGTKAAFINGQWHNSNRTIESRSPANLDNILGVFGEADKTLIADAAAAARKAFKTWSRTPAPVRAGVIQNFGRLVESNKEALASIVTHEIGKPYKEALGSVQEVIDTANFFVSEGRRLYGQTVPSEMPNKELFTYRRPIGVFGCLTACNFPVAVPAWYFIPALVAGNTCVWKPSEDSLLTSYWFTELWAKAGLPSGVFNTVFGAGATTGAAFVDLIESGAFDKIGFTGSTTVGRRIGEVCGRSLQTPCLELGGKNPMIVCSDADLELAVNGALFSGFGTGGQRCTSLGNLILHEKIYDQFVTKLVSKVSQIKIGDPFDKDITYGPLISQRFLDNHLDHLSTLIESHHELPLGNGGHIGHGVTWQNFSGNAARGVYARPNIVLNVSMKDRIYATETFGPLFNVLKFREFDEAMAMANNHGYGLSSAIYTNEPRTIYQFKQDITAGMSSINNTTTGAEAHLPFGGNGKSGNGGRQSGIWVIDQFTKWHAVNWDMSGRLQLAQMDTAYVEPDLQFRIS
ncbi:MAG: aldehyde dehydrogenase family protein [Deltaproteobacteria bacterium]|nr:aldehyde dehydrogenase family protein [Deltaproteobacteria bacterium]